MKKILVLLLLIVEVSIYAQSTVHWEDPFLKSDAPGYEDLNKAVSFHTIKDMAKYVEYLGKAGEKGNLAADHDLILCYLNGANGYLEKDTTAAIKMLFYVADKGYAPCQFLLGQYLFGGIGVTKNLQLGVGYINKSAAQGYLPAKSFLATSFISGNNGIPKDVQNGIKMAEECAIEGDIQSSLVLGVYYSGYIDGTIDYEKALKWYNLAADKGHPLAGNYLAYMYAKGEGVEKDYQKAHRLLDEAKNKAKQLGMLTKDIEANILDTDGEIYMMEEKNSEAQSIWQQMKTNYPEYVERNRFEVKNVFVRTMYEKEQKLIKPSLAANDNKNNVSLQIISDIDEKIPENPITGAPTFAVIIANENYMDVEGVPFASHDGETFKKYCEKTLGIPQNNIKFVKDATFNNMKRELNWLSQVMDVYQGEAKIILYYAGHGIPNEGNGSAFLLPVDGVGNDISTGYSLDKLYADLSSKPAKNVIVLLDACFSGAKRDGGMLASARGVAIKAKQNSPKGNMVVLSAAQGDETAYPYKEKGHGMFTYYLLKKLQETKGDITFGELADYVTSEVKKQSIVINGKMQTPLASPSSVAIDWRNWKLK